MDDQDFCIAILILKLEMTIFVIHNKEFDDETIIESIQQSKMHVELKAPTIGSHTSCRIYDEYCVRNEEIQ